MWLSNLRIAHKLFLVFGVVCLSIMVVGAVVLVSIARMGHAEERNELARGADQSVRDMLLAVVSQQNAVRGYVISGNEALERDYESQKANFQTALAGFRAGAPSPGQLARAATMEGLVQQWHDRSLEKQIALSRDPATRADAAKFVNGEYVGKIRQVAAEISDLQNRETARNLRQSQSSSALAQRAAIAGFTAVAALATALCWLLARGIARPVAAIRQAMELLAGGDASVVVPFVGRRDEVGAMAAALQAFRLAINERWRLEERSAAERAEAEAASARHESERAAAARQLASVVEAIAGGLSRLAANDLTVRLSEPFAAEYEGLRTDFNAAVAQLQATIRVIVANTAAIRSGTNEIAQASGDLSSRTEKQAASLEQTAAALDQITATVRKTAEGARQARDTVATTTADAEHSGEVVRSAVVAMSEIEASARKISQIIGVIDEIAFQTNLLALNAGVEAARAGDAGRGFAVVASEVRALAQRSADAAREIKALISTSTQQVGRGVELVGETGRALGRIVVQVGQINAVVGQIAASAQEQATGLHEVNAAISQMDQVTQQNAAMVEQSTAASHGLAAETQDLVSATSRFQLGDAAPLEQQPARADTVVALRPRRAAPPVHGGLARKPDCERDGWEEF